jgi:hypothetical protein
VADTVADTAVADTLVADTLEAALHMRPTGRLLGMQRLLEEVEPARLCCPSFQLRQEICDDTNYNPNYEKEKAHGQVLTSNQVSRSPDRTCRCRIRHNHHHG